MPSKSSTNIPAASASVPDLVGPSLGSRASAPSPSRLAVDSLPCEAAAASSSAGGDAPMAGVVDFDDADSLWGGSSVRLCRRHAARLSLRAGRDVTQEGVDALWEALCQPPLAPGESPAVSVVCAGVRVLVWHLQAPLWTALGMSRFLGQQRSLLAMARMGGEVELRVFDGLCQRTGSVRTGQRSGGEASP